MIEQNSLIWEVWYVSLGIDFREMKFNVKDSALLLLWQPVFLETYENNLWSCVGKSWWKQNRGMSILQNFWLKIRSLRQNKLLQTLPLVSRFFHGFWSCVSTWLVTLLVWILSSQAVSHWSEIGLEVIFEVLWVFVLFFENSIFVVIIQLTLHRFCLQSTILSYPRVNVVRVWMTEVQKWWLWRRAPLHRG